MHDIDNIPSLALSWLNEGRKIALATVIETWGSAPRRVGAQLVVDEDAQMMGSVSGGCVEGAVIFAALDAIKSGHSQILEFGVADEDAFAVGLACGGTIRILVQPVGDALDFAKADLQAIHHAHQNRETIISRTNLENFSHQTHAPQNEDEQKATRQDRSQISDHHFLRVYNPPLKLFIIGAVHIAQNLTKMAELNQFTPIIIDPRSQFATAERFPQITRIESYPDQYFQSHLLDPRSAVAALTHDPKIDDKALIAALNSQAFYIGALGSKRTHSGRVKRLEEAGFSPEQINRIHAPIGLDIGASTPSEIASSIIAEIIQTLRKF